MKFDIIGIGNPLMDLLVQVENKKVLELNLTIGSANFPNDEQITKIEKDMSNLNIKRSPGGNIANTIATMALLGAKAAFIGKVGTDNHGLLYEQELQKIGVHSKLKKKQGLTGKAIVFITPNAERTFAVHLGVATHLEKEDIIDQDIKQSKFLYLSGYELEDPKLKDTCIHAMDIAKKNNTKIVIDLADSALIKRNKENLKELAKKYAYMILANDLEAKAFTDLEPEQALSKIADLCEIAIIKLGEKGSIIKTKEKIIKIDPIPAKAIDTTGAGDSYTAGLLYCLANNHSLEKAGKLGSYIASKVIQKVGARLETIDKKEIDKLLDS